MEYLCGYKPSFNDKYSSLAHSVTDGILVTVKIKDLSEKIVNLVNSMLDKEQSKRPDINEVFATLKSPETTKKTVDKKTEEKTSGTTGLKLSGNLKGSEKKDTKIPSVTETPKIRFSSNLKK
jgi:hypothetical protein